MKTCPKCGLSMSDESRFCSACGADTVSGATAVTQTVTSPAPTIATDVPTSDKALASMILGLCVFVAGFLAGLPAVILGHMAKTEIRKSNGRLRGDGMALTGLILGYLSLALLPIMIILIIAAIAIPNLLRSKMAANEASAVGSLRTIMTASVTYYSTFGHGFPPTLTVLGPPTGGEAVGANYADLIDSTLAAGLKSGYTFTYEASSTRTDGVLDTFRVTADPIEPNTTGVRHFYVDQTGVIRYQEDGPANENSPPLQ